MGLFGLNKAPDEKGVDRTADVVIDPKDYPEEYAKLDREIVYHYSRSHRLSRAPERVRARYIAPPPKKHFAFFTCLFDTRAKAFTFASIIILCVVIFIMTLGK